MFTTILATPHNKMAIIPNGALANGNIINYSAEGRMRVDLTMGVAYGQPLEKVREVLDKVMREEPLVLQTPAPSVTVNKLNLEGIELAVRPWCDPKDYWTVYFGVLEKGIIALQAAGIEGPRPSMHITQ